MGGLCPHAPGSRCCQENVQARARNRRDRLSSAHFFGEGGKVVAGSPLLIANRLHTVKTVTRGIYLPYSHLLPELDPQFWPYFLHRVPPHPPANPHAFRSLVWVLKAGRAQVQAKLSTNL